MRWALELIAITFIPGLELRASIPYGIIGTDVHWLTVFAVCVITNMLLGPMVYVSIRYCMGWLTRIKLINKIYNAYVIKTQKRINAYIERYGEFGVAVFIGIPLPLSGSYSGALAAYLIGLKFRKFIVANIIGVLAAAIIVTAVTLTGSHIFNIFIRPV